MASLESSFPKLRRFLRERVDLRGDKKITFKKMSLTNCTIHVVICIRCDHGSRCRLRGSRCRRYGSRCRRHGGRCRRHGSMSAPREQMLAPQEQMPAPREQMLAPQEQMPAPRERMSAPREQMLAPQEQMPAELCSKQFVVFGIKSFYVILIQLKNLSFVIDAGRGMPVEECRLGNAGRGECRPGDCRLFTTTRDQIVLASMSFNSFEKFVSINPTNVFVVSVFQKF